VGEPEPRKVCLRLPQQEIHWDPCLITQLDQAQFRYNKKMPFLNLRLPERQDVMRVELQPQIALLVGREPQPERLSTALRERLRGQRIQEVRVASGRVSANHLLVILSNQEIHLWDLGSRNGSVLRLEAECAVILPAAPECTIELANLSSTPRQLAGPKDAEWASEDEFSTAVVNAINEWLAQTGIGARVAASNRPSHDGADETILLASGALLRMKPLQGATVEMSWHQVLDRIRTFVNEQNLHYEQLQGHDEDFVLASPIMRVTHRELSDAAAYGVRAMLLGPTGGGKERLARCYHRHSRHHRGPYVTVNCAVLKEGLLYAQLFGAKRGSFTGANADVVGLIESASDGTLFLDEVGDMDREVQKALLRFLDSRGEYQRLGESQVRRVTVQIVCATNLPLDDPEYRRGRFRDDLWYRLGVKVVRIPPLCERPEDILAFLRARTLRGGQVQVIDALSSEATQLVMTDPLPGNFRDLENFIDRLPATARPGSIDVATCAGALQQGRRPSTESARASGIYRAVAPAGEQTDWETMAGLAIQCFQEDFGDTPRNRSQLQIFTEKYVKPVFVAHSCRLAGASELSKNINYSDLARRMLIADGSTVKSHLLRYLERFGRKSG